MAVVAEAKGVSKTSQPVALISTLSGIVSETRRERIECDVGGFFLFDVVPRYRLSWVTTEHFLLNTHTWNSGSFLLIDSAFISPSMLFLRRVTRDRVSTTCDA